MAAALTALHLCCRPQRSALTANCPGRRHSNSETIWKPKRTRRPVMVTAAHSGLWKCEPSCWDPNGGHLVSSRAYMYLCVVHRHKLYDSVRKYLTTVTDVMILNYAVGLDVARGTHSNTQGLWPCKLPIDSLPLHLLDKLPELIFTSWRDFKQYRRNFLNTVAGLWERIWPVGRACHVMEVGQIEARWGKTEPGRKGGMYNGHFNNPTHHINWHTYI